MKRVPEETKNVLWAKIAIMKSNEEKKGFLLQIFNFKKYMIGALIALMVILGGGGAVVASNNAVPGDALYGLDLAVEKAKINFAGESEKKNELRVKFAEERVAEVKSKSKSEDDSVEIKSEKEKHDFELSLQSLSDMDGLSGEAQAKLNAAINEIRLILEANPDSKIKIENGDFKLEVKENGMVKFESGDDDDKKDGDGKDDSNDDKDGDDNKGHGNDDDGKDDDNPGKSTGVNINVGGAVNLGGHDDSDDGDDLKDGDDSLDDNGGEDDDNDDDNSGHGGEKDDDDDSGHEN